MEERGVLVAHSKCVCRGGGGDRDGSPGHRHTHVQCVAGTGTLCNVRLAQTHCAMCGLHQHTVQRVACTGSLSNVQLAKAQCAMCGWHRTCVCG
eukprot:357353-Chlamydomonas_euryale.AAC.4